MSQPTFERTPIHECVYYAHPTAYIDPKATIGRGTQIGAHASIEAGVVVGWNCRIGPGARIGQDGFGYEWNPGSSNGAWGETEGWTPKEHTFGVLIHDNVHIGANTCIDRGSWRATEIGSGTKIDNLVHVAHNVKTGWHCCIVAQAELSGSVRLEDRVYVGPAAIVRERLTVGEGSIVGMGAVVTKDVAAGMVVAGVPAQVLKRVDQWPPPPPEGK